MIYLDELFEDGFDGDILDFVTTIGSLDRGVAPKNLLETEEANTALENAYEWACRKEGNVYAQNAKAYIENIEQNREWDSDKNSADVIQILYILENLRYWRGNTAREAKKTLNSYIEERK
tara:strand:- start:538 stop:897 length:360 start_codon:yes stop_codon:yes gene_type:complete